MLHIGLIAQGGREWVGGLELTKNVIAATSAYCRSINRSVRFTVFGKGGEERDLVALPHSHDVEWASLPADIASRSIAQRLLNRFLFVDSWMPANNKNTRFADEFDRRKIDFVYPFHGLPDDARCRSAMWIPDLQHCHLPEFFSELELKQRTEIFADYGRSAGDIVFSSRDAERDFQEFFPTATATTHVIPFRVTLPSDVYDQCREVVCKKYHLPRRFLLICGQFWAHKNHMLLLKSMSLIRDDLPDLTVVMTGRLNDYRNPSYIDQFLNAVHANNLSDRVRLLGLVPKSDQLQLMRACEAVIQPSLFEGWSTVVEESHALGKPMILSDIAVHKEQDAPHSRFFSRHTAESLAEAIAEVWTAPAQDRQEFEECARASYQEKIALFGASFCKLATGVKHERQQVA